MDKIIVITGSTRGIGFGLAKAFLNNGCKVVISGRQVVHVNKAVRTLAPAYDSASIKGIACNVQEVTQVQRLWDESVHLFGKVDIWINNAGVAHSVKDTWELTENEICQLVETNILGTIYGSRTAIRGMLKQERGALYNIEGLGSNGSTVKGLSVYGMSKCAVGYLNKSLVKETKNTNVIVGIIRPGMVATDFIKSQYIGKDEEFERVKPIFNILCNRVEKIAPAIVESILKNKHSGKIIHGAPSYLTLMRFLSAPFVRRDVFND